MGDVGFFLLLVLVTMLSFGLSESLALRRRRLRRELIESRSPQSDEVFTAGVSAITPVPQGFVRAFRLAVGRALGIDHTRLLPTDRIAADLKAVNFDAWELSAVLERAFDMRVRVVDVMRAGTLRELCKQLHAQSEDLSESNPPLHRDPVPRMRAPEPEVVTAPIVVEVAKNEPGPDQPSL
ncbi:MAG: hypothetical protein H6840_07070 [Planctomycetes bacterium]|nr:hypothetical protein [Planctomycetota bacterium]